MKKNWHIAKLIAGQSRAPLATLAPPSINWEVILFCVLNCWTWWTWAYHYFCMTQGKILQENYKFIIFDWFSISICLFLPLSLLRLKTSYNRYRNAICFEQRAIKILFNLKWTTPGLVFTKQFQFQQVPCLQEGRWDDL